ncbi:GtrA family protein [Methanolacinia petrolearia DSM 11571]|uniref:GtrA family protein n=1 Tax=Methanolacinia petrolearia (strain DSM 11571 / OCM 486 / SEBR 4847) TaxID=679926 RepID=E1RKI1_METP4|nr:GtrA family protein [Methanolacinia petrolearia]ADN35834.1 GtrA family protein [Methanolacinia petrolearia DSM 11571]
MQLKTILGKIEEKIPPPQFIFGEKIIVFFFIGIVSSLADIGILYLLTDELGVWYLESAAVSYCCGTVLSYWLNKHLTFRDSSRKYLSQFLLFAAISISSLLLTLCIIWVSVEIFSLSYLTGKVIAIIIAFFWNFTGQSRITFKDS